ncbi:MAG TPA: peptidoglycan editing factor PgeF [Acidobacteriaceae bacterium]|nr:peptidoglycan editing factor PgeF [Acidobacteriaceae bacterium]
MDAILAGVGLSHGNRRTRAGAWEAGERRKKPRVSQGRAANRGSITVRSEGWDRYGWLRHGFSTRLGGVSEVYGAGELNVGWTASDDPARVAENRRRLVREVAGGTSAARLVTLRQVHSGMVRIVEAEDGALEGRLETAEGKAVLRGDGMMTDVPGVLLGIQVADCVPVLVADVRRRAVAAFHAGWRGTLRRIVERGIGRMRLRYGSRPEDLIAVVGPSIGACCYSVGEEVRHEFESQFAYAPELFSEVYDSDPVKEKYPLLFLTARAPGHSNIGPQTHLDLWEANRRQLVDAGLSEKRISVVGECTACTRLKGGRLKYYSHRGEHGFAGRMMGVVGVAATKA